MTIDDEALHQLLDVEIELEGVHYPNEYSSQLTIDRTALDGEFVDHARRYAYYATLADMAEDRHQRVKEELDKLYADLDHEVRAKTEAIKISNVKFKMTETMISSEIQIDKRYQDKLKEVQKARHLAKVLKNAPQAFTHRKDMLLALGKVSFPGSEPRVSQDQQQQQVRTMFATKAHSLLNTQGAPSLPPATTNGVATSIEIPEELVLNETTRRRTPKPPL